MNGSARKCPACGKNCGKPALLDLFSGAGGAARGYQLAGFCVLGVDVKPQPHYIGCEFIQADAMTFPLEGFDAIHASPPCQAYSIMHNLPWIRGREYPLLLLPTMERLNAADVPFVVENVMGARKGARGLAKRGLEAHALEAGWLCGTMFGMPFYRHRLFASNFLWLAPEHPKHSLNLHPRSERYVYGGTVKGLPGGSAGLDTKPRLGNGAQKAGAGIGHAKGWRQAAAMVDIDWMSRDELTQAIPPAFTAFIGKQLMASL